MADRYRYRIAGAALLLIALLAPLRTAGAAPMVFTDRTAWEAAVGGPFLTETFAGIPGGPVGLSATFNHISVQFDALDDFNRTQISAINERFDVRLVHASQTGPKTLDIFLPGPTTAFGFEFAAVSSGLLDLIVDGVAYTTIDQGGAVGFDFLGVTDTDAPFTSVRLQVANCCGELFTMDNLSFNSQVFQAPEPAAALLLGAGLLALAALRRR